MSADSALADGRRAAEGLMVDSGELRGPDVDGPIDESTGQYTRIPGPLKYSGRAKVQTTDTIGRAAGAGDRVVMVTRFEVHLPVSAAPAAVGDVWTHAASVNDPQLVGKRFRVASLVQKSYPTARRLVVEETQS